MPERTFYLSASYGVRLGESLSFAHSLTGTGDFTATNKRGEDLIDETTRQEAARRAMAELNVGKVEEDHRGDAA